MCTSTNAPVILDWAFNSARRCCSSGPAPGPLDGLHQGHPLDEMVVWDPDQEYGGPHRRADKKARILLWKGHCSVHQMFQPAHIIKFRNQYPEGKVISHPESAEVCRQSDFVGSTEYIIKVVKESAPGTRWLVGTGFQPGQSSGRRGEARGQDRPVHGAHRMHVLDHAAHRPAAPGLDPREPCRRQRGQSDYRTRSTKRR